MLDTNTVSQAIRGSPIAVRQRLEAAATTEVCLSTITEGELRFGLARRPEARALAAAVGGFMDRVDILPWDSAAAEAYGVLRARLEASGRPLGNLDMLIAAHALSVGAVLVTSDVAFRQVPDLEVDDWAIEP
jgi:tRNA(fMet)-specific endonuclease VapC